MKPYEAAEINSLPVFQRQALLAKLGLIFSVSVSAAHTALRDSSFTTTQNATTVQVCFSLFLPSFLPSRVSLSRPGLYLFSHAVQLSGFRCGCVLTDGAAGIFDPI